MIANISQYCDVAGLVTRWIAVDPLTAKEELENLFWYFEEYWKWTDKDFARSRLVIRGLLTSEGRRLYGSVFDKLKIAVLLRLGVCSQALDISGHHC